MRYNEKKAAQIAAFFIFKEGGTIGILKLMKLMYLAERKSFQTLGEPMTGDKLVSMNHGPVLSITLDHVNNFIDSGINGWESWISDRENHLVGLNRQINGEFTQSLDQLSDIELDILVDTWTSYGKFTGSQLRNITHEVCTEWEHPDNSSLPIPYSRILKCVGHDIETAKELAQRIDEQKKIDEMFNTPPPNSVVSKIAAG